jgi:hypothetical protein
VHREPRHLDEVAHGRLGHVGLPVRVAGETHRRIEGEPLFDRRLTRRVERQDALQAHQRIKTDKSHRAEEQHRDRIGHPVLIAALVDTGQPVERALDRTQHRRQDVALAGEDRGHVAAERPDEQDDDRAEQRDLKPTVESHGNCP